MKDDEKLSIKEKITNLIEKEDYCITGKKTSISYFLVKDEVEFEEKFSIIAESNNKNKTPNKIKISLIMS